MEAKRMAGHLIRRLHQVSTQVFARRIQEAGYDLTPVQFAAMDAIRSNSGVDQARVASLIAYDRATIGGVIDRLEKKGLVTRRVNTRDRRAREVHLTERGETVFTALLPVVTALQINILPGLDSAEQTLFLDLAAKALGADKVD